MKKFFEFMVNKLWSSCTPKVVVYSKQLHAIPNKTQSKGIIKLKNYEDKSLKAQTVWDKRTMLHNNIMYLLFLFILKQKRKALKQVQNLEKI